MNISERAREISPDIIKWRRTLHTFPETGNNTVKTARYIMEQLDAMGISYKGLVNNCAVVALIGPDTGNTVGLRADIDGLPLKEMTGLSFASQNGCMHACGHDMHAAMALGTAKLLKEMEPELPGQVKIFFQPGEEILAGARAMIAEGALEDPRPKAMLAMHVTDVYGLENGSILSARGPLIASCDTFEINISGKGGRGSEPDNCVDVITAACRIIDALQCIISREISPMSDAVLSVTGIHAGAEIRSSLPDSAGLCGTIRTHDEKVRAFIIKRIGEISQGIAVAMRAQAKTDIQYGAPCVVNDCRIVDMLFEAYSEAEDHKKAVERKPIMGGDDAAYFLNEIPGAYFMINNPQKTDGAYYPLHNSRVSLDDSVLYIGTETTVRTLLKLLTDYQ